MAEQNGHRGGQQYGRRGERSRHHPQGPRPPREAPLYTKTVKVEGKTFTIRTIVNPRGKAVEIREFSHGRDNIIVLPVGGLDEVLSAVDEAEDKLKNA